MARCIRCIERIPEDERGDFPVRVNFNGAEFTAYVCGACAPAVEDAPHFNVEVDRD